MLRAERRSRWVGYALAHKKFAPYFFIVFSDLYDVVIVASSSSRDVG